jgi:hypothetical protein
MEPTTTAATATVLNPITAGLLVGGSAYAGYKGAEYIHQRFSKSATAGLESVKQKSEMQELIEALKPKAPEPKSQVELLMEQMAAQQQALIAAITAANIPPVPAPAPAPVAPTPTPEPSKEGLLASLIASLMGSKVQEPTPAPAPVAPTPTKEELQMAALMELLSTTTAAPKNELSEVEAKLASAAAKKK